MFTGIIEGLGTLTGQKAYRGGRRISVTADFDLTQTALGDSIAVNGACLTVVTLHGSVFEADLSPETLQRTTFGDCPIGTRLNLERALRLSDRLDGHLVSGHIDGIGQIRQVTQTANVIVITIAVPPGLTRYMIPKGSVALDGVSLTINRCLADAIEVSIIPHTAHLATIGAKKSGDRVNVETDMIGKYVERLLGGGSSPGTGSDGKAGIDMALLAKSGFL
jgi:riboflavin synthase